MKFLAEVWKSSQNLEYKVSESDPLEDTLEAAFIQLLIELNHGPKKTK